MDMIVEKQGAGGRWNRDHETEAVSPPLLRLSFSISHFNRMGFAGLAALLACPSHPDLIPMCRELERQVATTRSVDAN